MRHGTYLCKTSTKRLVILGKNWLAFTTFVNHQANEAYCLGQRYPFRLFVYSFILLFDCVCFRFFCPFSCFLVFFLFLLSNFCLNANNKRQERKLIFIVDAQFGHSAAGIGHAYQWMRWHKSECLFGTGNCTKRD